MRIQGFQPRGRILVYQEIYINSFEFVEVFWLGRQEWTLKIQSFSKDFRKAFRTDNSFVFLWDYYYHLLPLLLQEDFEEPALMKLRCVCVCVKLHTHKHTCTQTLFCIWNKHVCDRRQISWILPSTCYFTSGPAESVPVVEGITWYQNGTVLTDPCIKPPCSIDLTTLKTWHYRRVKERTSVRYQEEGITRTTGCFSTDTLCAQFAASQ